MKRINKFLILERIWWLVGLYLAVGYVFPVLFRQRFMLLVFFLAFGLILLELKKEQTFILSACGMLILFFARILPTPFGIMRESGIPISLGITASVTTVFAISLVAGFTGAKVENLFKRSSSNQS